jgi:hypothetical protein
MEHVNVSSTSIRSIGYDSQTMTLEVIFLNETVYQYFEVPEHIYQGLLTAGSVGTYLNANVKGTYRYTRL